MVVDRLEHGWAGQLEHGCWPACSCISWLGKRTEFNNVVGTIMINQQPCSCMIEHVIRQWWNNKIEQRCYNDHELGCCIKSGFVCSITYAKNPCRFAKLYWQCVETWLNNAVILPIVFYHVKCVVTGLLSQQKFSFSEFFCLLFVLYSIEQLFCSHCM